MAKILTDEDILNATTYIPLVEKSQLAIECAGNCVVEVNIGSKVNDKDSEPLPPRAQESPMLKSFFGMRTIVCDYLHLEEKEKFDATSFDDWGRVAVFNQLDRLKMSKNQEVRNKVYDMVDDYREFYRMLGTEIAALVGHKNDTLSRALAWFSAKAMSETLKGSVNGLLSDLKELADYEAKPKEWQSESPTKDAKTEGSADA